MTSQAIAAVIGASATLTACIGIALAPPGSAAPGRSCSEHGSYQIAIKRGNVSNRDGVSDSGDISCSNAYSQYNTYRTAPQYHANPAAPQYHANPTAPQYNANPTAAQPNVQGLRSQGTGRTCYSYNAQQYGTVDLQFGCARTGNLNVSNGNNG